MTSAYAGQVVALLTQHGKERTLAPILEPALGCRLHHVTGFDTDQLGTFTRDIPRVGTQLEAARRKARIGMERSGARIGLASEGSFGADPFSGMFGWNVEMLVLVDDRLGIEVVGLAQGPARSGHVLTGDWTEVEDFARRQGFPSHYLVVRPADESDPRVLKGLNEGSSLKAAFDHCLALSENGQVFVETDLRAFANPTRMERIGQAAHDLTQRLLSPCPACAAPGYWLRERHPGLPCRVCGTPTQEYLHEVWACVRCASRQERTRTDLPAADPAHCPRCNP